MVSNLIGATSVEHLNSNRNVWLSNADATVAELGLLSWMELGGVIRRTDVCLHRRF